jgi:hypothetical protein
MNEFELTLMKLNTESEETQVAELELRQRAQLFNQKLMGFLKENGLPENFTLPQLALLAARKCRV